MAEYRERPGFGFQPIDTKEHIGRAEYDASGLPTEAAMQIAPVGAWNNPGGYADRKAHQVLRLTDLVRSYDEAYYSAASHEGYLGNEDRPVGSLDDEEDYR